MRSTTDWDGLEVGSDMNSDLLTEDREAIQKGLRSQRMVLKRERFPWGVAGPSTQAHRVLMHRAGPSARRAVLRRAVTV